MRVNLTFAIISRNKNEGQVFYAIEPCGSARFGFKKGKKKKEELKTTTH